MLVTRVGAPMVGPRIAKPTMPVVLVLTPSIEGALSSTSSRKTPGARYSGMAASSMVRGRSRRQPPVEGCGVLRPGEREGAVLGGEASGGDGQHRARQPG